MVIILIKNKNNRNNLQIQYSSEKYKKKNCMYMLKVYTIYKFY